MTNNAALQPMVVMLSSVGRRSQLIQCFREAFLTLGIQGRIVGTDIAPDYAPAAHLLDACYRVPRCTDPGFLKEALGIAQLEGVRLIVPTIDTELPVYAANRRQFLVHGISVVVSDPGTIEIACDKTETNRWLMANGFPTVRQASLEAVLADPSDWTFPVVVKPRFGSASINVAVVKSAAMLKTAARNQPEMIVQEEAVGIEHTVNVFVEEGKCLCAVPHRRIETRGGEVSKGITRRSSELMRLMAAIAERLPGARGPLNIQGFVDSANNIKVIEINARFGGGFPLANQAGAKFPLWLLEELLGLPSSATWEWQDNLLMLRYDSAVFVGGAHA
jgi:carbamoyl-phosphate synthase large subunit